MFPLYSGQEVFGSLENVDAPAIPVKFPSGTPKCNNFKETPPRTMELSTAKNRGLKGTVNALVGKENGENWNANFESSASLRDF
ncbi:hypothetical protein CEXT_223651 [Caerostris extrusa]|uniref:Uncharacterized protein n=1 Tax=Caerostris extrusa TaxID=172846 RepID=A0AAV4XX44_CAEEX|nr:hypothetical protein CEXT_223651 [Caerostris extrusa]